MFRKEEKKHTGNCRNGQKGTSILYIVSKCELIDLKGCQMTLPVYLSSSPPWPPILPFSSLPLVFSSQSSSGSESLSLLRVPSLPVQSPFRCWETSEILEHTSSGYRQTIGQSSTVNQVLFSLGDCTQLTLGDVVYLHILGISLVFLNTKDAVSDLLDRKGSIYSDKPSLVMTGELWVS